MAATTEVARKALDPAMLKRMPGVLLRFFQKFPPGQEYATETQRPEQIKPKTKVPEDGGAPVTIPIEKKLLYKASTPFSDPSYNPFLPWRNPITLRWRGPYYSLRRQAILCKKAASLGIEDALPFSIKKPSVKLAKRMERGLRMRGTGEGQKVKGHKSERTMKAKMEKRKKAMVQMPRMVQQWKQRGHGRGWKKWPRG